MHGPALTHTPISATGGRPVLIAKSQSRRNPKQSSAISAPGPDQLEPLPHSSSWLLPNSFLAASFCALDSCWGKATV